MAPTLMGFVLSARNKLPDSHRIVSRHKDFGWDNH
jgi:hypothetical protein